MSTISSLGSNSPIYTVSNSKQNSVTTDSSSSGGSTTYVATATGASNATSANAPRQAQQSTPHHHRGHGNHDLFQKIKTAVTNALQSSQSDSSSDPNQVVEDAIAQVLQENGITSAGKSSPQGNSSTSTSGTAGQTTASATDSRQAFQQLLQSYGIDGEQFHNDLKAAIQKAQNGAPDPSIALQSIPSGTVFSTET